MRRWNKGRLAWKSNTYPETCVSGYDNAVIARWLQEVLQPFQATFPDYFTLLWGLNSMVSVWYGSDWFLTPEALDRVRILGTVFMRTYMKLANESISKREL